MCLPPKLAERLGNLGPLVLCTRVASALTLLDPVTLRHTQLEVRPRDRDHVSEAATVYLYSGHTLLPERLWHRNRALVTGVHHGAMATGCSDGVLRSYDCILY